MPKKWHKSFGSYRINTYLCRILINTKTMDKQYQVVNGTYYDARTNKEVINVLEQARTNRTRIVVDYGDVETGSWQEEFDVTGYVGRSFGGKYNVPLLVHNARSMGGGAMLDHCIVKISTSKGKKVLYKHPKYFVE